MANLSPKCMKKCRVEVEAESKSQETGQLRLTEHAHRPPLYPTTTAKKMEPRPSFNIKNALNGFTYNLVPEDH